MTLTTRRETYQIAIIGRGGVIQRVAVLNVDAGVVGIASPPNFIPDHLVEVPQRIEVKTQIRSEVVVQFELVSIELRIVVQDVVTVHYTRTIEVLAREHHFVIVAIHFVTFLIIYYICYIPYFYIAFPL